MPIFSFWERALKHFLLLRIGSDLYWTFFFLFFFQSSISMAKDWLIFVSIGGLGFEK
jgi:hypothetical protein